GQGRARARTAANRRPDGAPRGDRVVRRARVRRAPAEDRVIGHLAARLTRKSRSNFYYAFLALPKPRRDALYAVYAFCRTVDDIADLGDERGTDRAEQRRALDRWRRDVALCYEPGGAPADPIAARLAQAVRAFAIPKDALLAIIDGVAMARALGGSTTRRRRAARLWTRVRSCRPRSWGGFTWPCSKRSRRVAFRSLASVSRCPPVARSRSPFAAGRRRGSAPPARAAA